MSEGFGALQGMEILSLQENNFVGELPMSWAAAGRFPALSWLELWKNSLSGAIPATWGNWNSFPAIKSLCAPALSLLYCWRKMFEWSHKFALCYHRCLSSLRTRVVGHAHQQLQQATKAELFCACVLLLC